MIKDLKDHHFFAWLAALAGIGAVLVLWLTHMWGLGVAGGSMCYVEAARHFVTGQGFSVFSKVGTLEPLVLAPPGFPFLVSWGWFLGFDAFHWARLLHAFSWAANIFLAGILAWSWSGNRLAGLMAAGFFLISPQLFETHLAFLAEPVFLTVTLLFFIALDRYVRDGGRGMFYAMASCAALAGLIRISEIVFLLTAWSVFFSVKGEGMKGKALKAFFFLLVAGILPALWCARNFFLGKMGWGLSPFLGENIYRFFDVLSLWLLPLALPAELRWIVLGVAIASAISLWRWRSQPTREGITSVAGIRAALLFMGVYLLGSLVLMMFVFPSGDMEGHLFSPVLGMALVVLACFSVKTHLRKAVIGVLVVFALLALGRTVKVGLTFLQNGKGYSSRAWTESKVLKELRALDERVTVYTNDPRAISYLIGRPAVKIPLQKEGTLSSAAVRDAVKLFDDRLAVGVIFKGEDLVPGAGWAGLMQSAALKNVMSDDIAAIYVQKKSSVKVEKDSGGDAPQK